MRVSVEHTGVADFGCTVGGVDGLLRTELEGMSRKEQRQLELRISNWITSKAKVSRTQAQCAVRRSRTGDCYMVMVAIDRGVRDTITKVWTECGGMKYERCGDVTFLTLRQVREVEAKARRGRADMKRQRAEVNTRKAKRKLRVVGVPYGSSEKWLCDAMADSVGGVHGGGLKEVGLDECFMVTTRDGTSPHPVNMAFVVVPEEKEDMVWCLLSSGMIRARSSGGEQVEMRVDPTVPRACQHEFGENDVGSVNWDKRRAREAQRVRERERERGEEREGSR